MPRGRPRAPWLRQVEFYMKGMDMTGLASVWANGQTEAGVQSQGGRGDALLRRMSPYLT